MSWNGAGYPLVRDANDATLYHTWSEQYWQIKYESANDRWTITTEDGTQYQLGYSTNSRAVQWRRDGDASHNRAETYAWWLEKAIDPHGNDIAYSYRHDTMTTDCGYAGWGPYTYDAALYPQSIRYNRNASGTYLTEIALDYEARSDHAAITTNTQCGAPMQTLRLKWINVSTSDGATMRAVRKYRLDHDYSTFPGVWHGGANYGRLTLKSITQYGTDGTTALPAQVFTYQNNRLWQVQNGIGGAVSFAYEDIRFDWAARAVQGWDFSGCSGQGWNPCSNEWGPGTANVSMADNAMYIGASGIQYAVLTAPRFIPGIYYRLHAGFRGEGRFKLVGYDGVSEKLIHDWDTPWWCPGCDWGGYFKLDHASSQVSIRIYVDNSIVILNNAWLEMDPTYYRVTGRSISDGQGNTATYSYGYTGAALNHPSNSTAGRFAAGTVSRGHAQVTVTDPTGAKTEHYFKQDDVYQGRLEKVVQLGANGSKFTQAQNTYAARPIPVATVASGDQSNFVYLSQTVHDLYDGQASPVTSKTVYDYDGYGNLSRSDEYSDATTLYRRTLQTYYPPSTALNAQRIINKLKTYQVYIGGATLTQETRYSYDGLPYETAPTKGALYQVQVKTSPNAAFFLQITYGYDTYGNRTSVTDALNHTTTIQYDPIYATIPVAVTRPAPFSFQTVTQYNYRLGKPVTVSDPNSAVTTYEYDGFGRTTKIWLPLQQGHANPTVRYTYALGNPRSLVQVEARADEGLVNSTATYQAAWWFYDGLGRVIQQQARGLNNQTILVNTAYDSRGQTGRVSNPYYAAASGGTYQAPNWGQPFTEHRYDALGRETMTINPDPTIIQTTGYDRRVTRITDANGHWRELTADAFGRTTQVTERNQGVSYNTTYIYDVLNRLWRVTDAAGNQTTMNYDWLGRKASMTDPDLGTWSYGYDNAGNLTRQTDAKNQTTCLYYDELNRLKGQNYQFANSQCANDPNNYTVTNTYDQGTNGIGRRTGLSDPSGTTAWTYDRHGRVTTQTNTIIGAPSAYVTRWTYDAMNRPLSMIYPDGETVPITYNDQGLLATLGTFAATTNDSYNAANQLTQLKLNNGATTTTYIYDSRNLRLTQLTTSGSLQNLSYEYDGVGNVKKITDWVRSEVSTFGYDDLDRLTSASIAGVYSQGWQYNAIGNIIQTTNNGTPTNYTYRYDPNDTTKKPHAVTQVGSSYSVSYDANGNLTARPSGPLQYDAENRLRQVIRGGVTTTYLYDGDGQRVRKIEYSAASVTLTDPFDTSNPALWSWSGYQSVPFNDAGQNVVKSTGTDANWNGNFYRNAYGLTHGQSASIDFKVDSAETYLHLALESSDGGVYSRWALIAAQSKLYVQYNNDGWWIYPQDLINPVKLNTWYRLTLRVDDVNGFRIEVRERDGAGASGGYTRAMPAGKTWRFHSWIYRGTAYLDNYSEQSDNARATYYVGNWYEVTNGAVTKYYYFGGQRVAMRTSAGVTYLHSDHLGSTSVTSGASASTQTYYPYGAVRSTTGTLPTDYTFTGQKRDNEAGLHYYGARYYERTLSRFIQPDTVIPDFYNPQSLNRYAYALNNPVSYVDPSGHAPQKPGDPDDTQGDCTTDWCWENRWYAAHGYNWDNQNSDWV
ncbi:MAG: hypothetical protein HY782_28305, partial [Chloroflexi bacterium]|nr:hypothetical protein [Chloroflexota bacterium]